MGEFTIELESRVRDIAIDQAASDRTAFISVEGISPLDALMERPDIEFRGALSGEYVDDWTPKALGRALGIDIDDDDLLDDVCDVFEDSYDEEFFTRVYV